MTDPGIPTNLRETDGAPNVCPKCGTDSPIVYRFCVKCGAKLPNARPIRSVRRDRSRTPHPRCPEPQSGRRPARRRRKVERRLTRLGSRMLGLPGIWHALIGVVLLACLCTAYAYLVEPNRVVRRSYEIAVPDLPPQLDGFRIVQISDTHIGGIGRREQRAIRIVNRSNADIVVLTGDMSGSSVEERGQRSNDYTIRFLSHLRSKRGKFAILGTWDTDVLFRRLQEAAVRGLIYNTEVLNVGGAELALLGLTPDDRSLDLALEGIGPDAVKIALAADVTPVSTTTSAHRGIALSLTGAKHGGQVRIPLIHRLYWHGPEIGLRRIDGMWHYASPGLGTAHTRARFFCPPEVAVFTLRREGGSQADHRR